MIYVLFAAVCMLLPVTNVWTFRAGYNVGITVCRGEAIKKAAPRHFIKKDKESKEEQVARIIHDNIEAYGTNVPQKDVM